MLLRTLLRDKSSMNLSKEHVFLAGRNSSLHSTNMYSHLSRLPFSSIHSLCKVLHNVTGTGKRDIFAHTMVFQYKCCCSKTRHIFILKKNNFGLNGIYNSAYTHTKFEELNALLTGQARCLKTGNTSTLF